MKTVTVTPNLTQLTRFRFVNAFLVREDDGFTLVDTTLPKGVDGSLGLDSLDFIELSVGIEERFGIVIDEREDLTDEFLSLQSLARFVLSKSAKG